MRISKKRIAEIDSLEKCCLEMLKYSVKIGKINSSAGHVFYRGDEPHMISVKSDIVNYQLTVIMLVGDINKKENDINTIKELVKRGYWN